jgi:hypothetical protein
MTDIEQKIPPTEYNPYLEAMRWQGRAQDFQAKLKTKELELEEFKKKFSDAAKGALSVLKNTGHAEAVVYASKHLIEFIIPAPKPDPLVDACNALCWDFSVAEELRTILDALGFEIKEKNDD